MAPPKSDQKARADQLEMELDQFSTKDAHGVLDVHIRKERAKKRLLDPKTAAASSQSKRAKINMPIRVTPPRKAKSALYGKNLQSEETEQNLKSALTEKNLVSEEEEDELLSDDRMDIAIRKETAKKLIFQQPRGKNTPSNSAGSHSAPSVPSKGSKKQIVAQTNEEPMEKEEEVDSDGELLTKSDSKKGRGIVTMEKVTRRKMMGVKVEVLYNRKGQPLGSAATQMQSYIGALVRRKVKITHKNWNKVTNTEKDKVWQMVQQAFDLGAESRQKVMASVAEKFRVFKSNLTTKIILPLKDEPQWLEEPPQMYSIPKDVWNEFVKSRLTKAWEENHKKQSARRSLNKYPHRLSRKGYAGLEAELLKTMDEKDIDRSTLWLKAREDKTGNIPNPNVAAKAKEIVNIDKLIQIVIQPYKSIHANHS